MKNQALPAMHIDHRSNLRRDLLLGFLTLTAIVGLLLSSGCQGIYKPAAIVVVTAEKAMTSYGHYYDSAIANPPAFNVSADQLNAQRRQVDRLWESYRTAMNAVDDTRKAGGDVTAALQTAQAYSDQLVNLILSFLPNEYKPK